MKKIPTLFKRTFENGQIIKVTEEVNEGCEFVLQGEGIATLKLDGSCTAIMDGVLYKRYDAKRGKTPPPGAIPCCGPDPITGHHPHWLKVDENNPADKWLVAAFKEIENPVDGTYEIIGKHFQGNPYKLENDVLVRHGEIILDVPRTFEEIRDYLAGHNIEGIVFWKDGEPRCKIKRSDFGFIWNQETK